MPMAAKPDKLVAYNEELPSVKSWSCDFDFSYMICRFRMQTPKSSPIS